MVLGDEEEEKQLLNQEEEANQLVDPLQDTKLREELDELLYGLFVKAHKASCFTRADELYNLKGSLKQLKTKAAELQKIN